MDAGLRGVPGRPEPGDLVCEQPDALHEPGAGRILRQPEGTGLATVGGGFLEMMMVNTAACSAGGGRVRRHRKWIRQAVRSGGGRCPGVRAVRRCVNQTVARGLDTEPRPVSMPTFCPLPPVTGIIAPSTRGSVKSWYVYASVCACTGVCRHAPTHFLCDRWRLRTGSSRSSWSDSGKTWEPLTWQPQL